MLAASVGEEKRDIRLQALMVEEDPAATANTHWECIANEIVDRFI